MNYLLDTKAWLQLGQAPTQIPLRVRKILLGDANGADKAAQHWFHGQAYSKITVFHSGDRPRNNLGDWPSRQIVPKFKKKDFFYHSAKDLAMAEDVRRLRLHAVGRPAQGHPQQHPQPLGAALESGRLFQPRPRLQNPTPNPRPPPAAR